MENSNIEQIVENQVVENQIDENHVEEIKEVKTKGRVYIKKRLDGGGRQVTPGKMTEYGKPINPDYFKDYYKKNQAQKVTCDICKMEICKASLKKHYESSYHKYFVCQLSINEKTINDKTDDQNDKQIVDNQNVNN